MHPSATWHEDGNVRIGSETFHRIETKADRQQNCGRISQLSGDELGKHETAGEVGLPIETGAVVGGAFARDGPLDDRAVSLLSTDFQLAGRNASHCLQLDGSELNNLKTI